MWETQIRKTSSKILDLFAKVKMAPGAGRKTLGLAAAFCLLATRPNVNIQMQTLYTTYYNYTTTDIVNRLPEIIYIVILSQNGSLAT